MSKADSLGNVAMHDLHIFDTFSEPSHITIGDKYTADRPPPDDSRYKGKQLLSTPGKLGRTDKVLLERNYKPLGASDPYVDMIARERKMALEESKKHPVKPFIPANPPKKAVGKGSLYGTLAKPPEHKPEGVTEIKKGDVKSSPRNFLTNPLKKGSYGFYHTTIGAKEFEYQSEPLGGVKKKVAGQIEHKPIAKPFQNMHHGERAFDSKVYSEDGIKKRAVTAPRKEKPIAVPFKSMTPMRGTIAKFPEYVIPPAERAMEGKKDVQHEKIWKPSGTNDLSIPSKSVALHGLAEQQTFTRSRRM